MSCNTYSYVLHAFFRKSYILLTFRRYQVMYSVFHIVLCVHVKYIFSYNNEKKLDLALVSDHIQHCVGFLLLFIVYNYDKYSILESFILSALLLLH